MEAEVSTQQLFIKPRAWKDLPGLIAAQSTRHGGVSPPPFDELNMGLFTPDSPENVSENRKRFLGALGIRPDEIVSSRQVHGKEVKYVTEPGYIEGFDGMFTDVAGLFLTITIADCTPILIYDTKTPAVGAVHAGWKSTVRQVAREAIRQMNRQVGTDPAHCRVWMGVCIGKDEYEVDADVADQFPGPFRRWDAARGKFLLDVPGANRAQLEDEGVPPGQISQSPYTTLAQLDHFFSHRGAGGRPSGRMMVVIGLRD